MLVASVADLITCCFTRSGSIIILSHMLTILPVLTSMPMYLLSFFSCSLRKATMMSIGSKPAFSARVVGIASTASANASIASCSRPPTLTAYARKPFASSASGAPPPATILPSSITFRTTHKPSCRLRSASSITWFDAPRITRVTALGFLQSRM